MTDVSSMTPKEHFIYQLEKHFGTIVVEVSSGYFHVRRKGYTILISRNLESKGYEMNLVEPKGELFKIGWVSAGCFSWMPELVDNGIVRYEQKLQQELDKNAASFNLGWGVHDFHFHKSIGTQSQ